MLDSDKVLDCYGTVVNSNGTVISAKSEQSLASYEFDARRWFCDCSKEDLDKLILANWSGEPAIFIANEISKHNRIFRSFIKAIPKTYGKRYSYRCYINKESAKRWLKKNRPILYGEVFKE